MTYIYSIIGGPTYNIIIIRWWPGDRVLLHACPPVVAGGLCSIFLVGKDSTNSFNLYVTKCLQKYIASCLLITDSGYWRVDWVVDNDTKVRMKIFHLLFRLRTRKTKEHQGGSGTPHPTINLDKSPLKKKKKKKVTINAFITSLNVFFLYHTSSSTFHLGPLDL
jgi:hypothetical protein